MSDHPAGGVPEKHNAAPKVRNLSSKKKPEPTVNTQIPQEALQRAAIPTTSYPAPVEHHCTAVADNTNGPDAETLRRAGSAEKHQYFRVLDCGAMAQQGTRKTMEDQHVMVFDGIPFFGVYDGHGGMQCAEYLRDNLHQMILSHPEVRRDPAKAIRAGIMQAEESFLHRSGVENDESGSVCAVALILDDTLVVGNVGDCEAVLSRNCTPVLLTVKHSLKCNPSEVERVKTAGGKIFNNRVGHPKFNPSVVSLAVTRAIGDAGFKLEEYTDGKPSGIIAEPDVSATKLTDEDEFMVIGCDGLWDVMKYEEVVDFCCRRLHDNQPAQSIASELAQAAITKGSNDNVTAMLICLECGAKQRGCGPKAVVSTSTRDVKSGSEE